MLARPGRHTGTVPVFSRPPYLLSLAGVKWSRGVSPEPGNRTRLVLLPKQAGYPAPSLRITRASGPGVGATATGVFVMPSAVEFSKISTTGHAGVSLHGRQESNPQRTDLETAALPN